MYNDWTVLIILSVGVLLSILAASILKRLGTPAWLARKFLHTSAISICAIMPLLVKNHEWVGVVVFLIGLLLAYLIKKYDIFEETDNRKNYGIALFTLPYGALLLFHHTDVHISLAMFILAFSDSLACILGKVLPLKKWSKTDSGKSVGGSLAFFTSSILCFLAFIQAYPAEFSNFPFSFILLLSAWVSMAELMGEDGWDNVWVPLFTALFLPFFTQEAYLTEILVITALGAIFIWVGSQFGILSWRGALSACFLALSTVLMLKAAWLLPLFLFLFSSWLIGKIFPNRVLSDHKAGKMRDEWQVWSNGGSWLIALCLHFWGLFNAYEAAFICLILMSAATADTWSSQFGTYFSGQTWDVLKWRSCPAGVSGGISLAGSLAGLAGSIFLAMAGYWLIPNFSLGHLAITGLAGFGGMLLDSVLGSVLQAKYRHPGLEVADQGEELLRGFRFMTNDLVNFLSQLILLGLCAVFL